MSWLGDVIMSWAAWAAVVEAAVVSFALGVALWQYKLFRQGEVHLTLTHDIKAVLGSGKSGKYFLMVTTNIHNPSKVKMVPEEGYCQIWDLRDATCVKEIKKKPRIWKDEEMVLEPGETQRWHNQVILCADCTALKIKTAVIDTRKKSRVRGQQREWEQTSVFELHPKGGNQEMTEDTSADNSEQTQSTSDTPQEAGTEFKFSEPSGVDTKGPKYITGAATPEASVDTVDVSDPAPPSGDDSAEQSKE